MTTKPPLLTIEQVAQRLNIKLRNAYELLAPGGRLHALRIQVSHKVVRVDADKLEEFLSRDTTR